MKTWTTGQIKSFVKAAKETSVGKDGWAFLGPKIQTALIEATALHVVLGSIGCTLTISDVRELRHAMMVEAGLEKKDA